MLPAAGRAERLQPLAGSKEVLEIGGRPVLDYAVDRLLAAPAAELRIVVHPEKRDVAERAEHLGLIVVEAMPATLAESVVAGIEGLAENDVVLVDLPDSLWAPVDGFAHLLAALKPQIDVVLALFTSTEPERGDVVELDREGHVVGVHVKSEHPPGNLIWGAVAARAGVLQTLREHAEPGHLFDELARRGRVGSVRFAGEFVDIGTKEALERARKLLG